MQGTITRRTLKGSSRPSWGYVFDLGRDQGGKRLQATKSGFKSKAEAHEALRAAIADRQATAKAASKPAPALIPTFADFFDRWIAEHAARRCSPKTLEAYGQHGAYAKREFGTVPLNELTPELL